MFVLLNHFFLYTNSCKFVKMEFGNGFQNLLRAQMV